MRTRFTAGIKKTLVYYIVGFGIAYLSTFIPGLSYGHGPGLYHVIGFLVLAGGAGWSLHSLVRIILDKNDQMHIASLLLNIIVIGGVWLYLYILINQDGNDDITPFKEDVITIHFDSSRNSSYVVNGLGDTLLLKVGDSVVIDKLTKEPTQ